jgi:acetyl-CoA synthetase
MRRLLRDILLHGSPQGDISVIEDASALDAVTAAISGPSSG